MQKLDLIDFYQKIGLTLIPLKKDEKKPVIVKWASLSRKKLEEFDLKNYEGNIGIRIEPPIFVVDIDDRRLAPLILDEVPSTWIVETRRGFHVYLKAENYYPATNKKSRFIQLLAKGCQIVAPPSVVEGHEYRFVKGPNIEIAELGEQKTKMIERIVESFAKHEQLILSFTKLWSEGHRHNLSLWLNGALRKSGVDKFEAAVIVKSICLLSQDPEVKDRLRALEDTYEKPIEKIGAWSYLKAELESIVGPEHAAEILKLMPKIDEETKKEEKARKKKVSGPLVLEDAGVWIEPIEEGLLVIRGDGYEVCEEFDYGGVKYVKDGWIDGVVVLPPKPEEINSVDLWNMTKEFLETYLWFEDERFYDLLVCCVAWSYFYDRNPWTFYVFISGPYGSGKTRLLETLRLLCYRSVLSSIARGPSLYRLIERLSSLTLLIDEVRTKDPDIVDLLRVGYRNNNLIVRTHREKEGLRKFRTYCFKVFANVDEPTQDVRERSIRIRMVKSLAPLPKKLDEDLARRIRAGWMYQRITKNVVVSGDEYKSEFNDNRVEELFSPIICMAKYFNPNVVEKIKQLLREFENERDEELRDTLESEIVEELLKLVEKEPERDFVSVGELVTLLGNQYSNQKIGRCMARLGFMRVRRGSLRERGYILEKSKILKLGHIYRVKPINLNSIIVNQADISK
ncbi:MAG: bifunctional DNA primase/polymerase [Desulfurococcaceae archaeon]